MYQAHSVCRQSDVGCVKRTTTSRKRRVSRTLRIAIYPGNIKTAHGVCLLHYKSPRVATRGLEWFEYTDGVGMIISVCYP
jgi:hypothetical protein